MGWKILADHDGDYEGSHRVCTLDEYGRRKVGSVGGSLFILCGVNSKWRKNAHTFDRVAHHNFEKRNSIKRHLLLYPRF